MCKCPAVECRMLTYLQSSRVRLEATCWVLCGHTALDGIAIDPYLVLFQTQLRQTATFTHSQLSMYQIHTGREGEREKEKNSGYIAFAKQQKHTLPQAPKPKKNIQHGHFITPCKYTLSGQTRSAIWNHNRFNQTILSRLTFQQVQHAEKIFTPVRRESARYLLAPITSIRQA